MQKNKKGCTISKIVTIYTRKRTLTKPDRISEVKQVRKELVDKFREQYNIIFSSRDIVKMYPDVTYHFFIDASIEERTNRKYIQYNKEIPKEQIKEMIQSRDELQEKSGYYKIYPQTKIIDVTNCKSIEESAQMVLKNMKETIANGI